MKIRNGFVTNSSSSSFVITKKNENANVKAQSYPPNYWRKNSPDAGFLEGLTYAEKIYYASEPSDIAFAIHRREDCTEKDIFDLINTQWNIDRINDLMFDNPIDVLQTVANCYFYYLSAQEKYKDNADNTWLVEKRQFYTYNSVGGRTIEDIVCLDLAVKKNDKFRLEKLETL